MLLKTLMQLLKGLAFKEAKFLILKAEIDVWAKIHTNKSGLDREENKQPKIPMIETYMYR